MKENSSPSSFYQSLFERLPCPIAIYRPVNNGTNFILTDGNKALATICNVSRKDIIGKSIQGLFPEIETTGILDLIKQVNSDGPPIEHPAASFQAQGRTFWATTSISKLGNDIVVIFDDITKSNRNALELKKFKTLFDTSLFGHAIADLDGTLTYVNSYFAEIHGYRCEDLIGRNVSILHSQSQLNEVTVLLEKFKANGKFGPQNVPHAHKNGEELIMLMTGIVIKDDIKHKQFYAISAIDVTKQEKLKEEHFRLTTAIQQTADTIVITDPSGNIQYVNPAFEKLTGYSQQEAIGTNPRILKSGVHSKEFYENLWSTISRGKVWRGRIHNKRKDGTFFTEDASISPVLSANNKIQNYVAVKQDITRELELLEQLQQAVKMEAIGTLAGGIAHDFNNILTTINGFTILAMDTLSSDQEAYDDLQQVLTATDRAADLVKQILLYSRKQNTNFLPLQPVAILKETFKMLQASLPPNIRLNLDYDEKCHYINADGNQIQQIFVNLASNASQAMGDRGGTLSFSVANSSATPQLNAPHIVFTIRDSGKGIDVKNIKKIFDPFFTTKAIGEGTGLGLSVVHGIVENHNGCIELESEEMNGSTFTIRIPAILEEVGPQSVERDPIQVSKGEQILIVDDEPAVGEILRRVLNKAGYKTTYFDSSRKALLHFNTNPTKYDLLLTDFIMPDIDGSELAMLMVQKNKNLQVIICTGHVGSFGEENGKKEYPTNFLYKPIQHDLLLSTVRKVLSP